MALASTERHAVARERMKNKYKIYHNEQDNVEFKKICKKNENNTFYAVKEGSI